MIEPRPLQPGDPERVGQYRLLACLGAGGQGTVYLGETPAGQRVAVKMLHARMSRDARARERFLKEIAAAQRVRQFCTARVLDVDTDSDQPYIISEYVDGPPLADLVDDEGPRDPDALERLAVATITAIAAIHKAGIVHRDFKPSNVICGPDGPRVIDFGIARALDATTTTLNTPMGTPAYMSPEQVSAKRVGPASDVFSWAATILFAATGMAPFGRDTIPATFHRILNTDPDLTDLSEPLRSVISTCLVKDPDVRPAATAVLLSLLGHDNQTHLATGDSSTGATETNAGRGAAVGLSAEGVEAAVDRPSDHPQILASTDLMSTRAPQNTERQDSDTYDDGLADSPAQLASGDAMRHRDGGGSASDRLARSPESDKRRWARSSGRFRATVVAAVVGAALATAYFTVPLWRSGPPAGKAATSIVPNVTAKNRDDACAKLRSAGFLCADRYELAPNYRVVNRQDDAGTSRLTGSAIKIYWSRWKPVTFFITNTGTSKAQVWTMRRGAGTHRVGGSYAPETNIPNGQTINQFTCSTQCQGVAGNRLYTAASSAGQGWVNNGAVATFMACGDLRARRIYQVWKNVGKHRLYGLTDNPTTWRADNQEELGCVW